MISLERKKCKAKGRIRHKYDHHTTEKGEHLAVCRFCPHVKGNPYTYIDD